MKKETSQKVPGHLTTKKAYRTPRLVEFGDVSRLTHANVDGLGKRDNDTDRNLKEMS